MKLNVITLALAATAFGAFAANAQTVIEERRDPPVVVEHDHPSVTIEKREHPAVIEKKRIETTGSGCDSKTVHKETDYGSKTVTKSNCD